MLFTEYDGHIGSRSLTDGHLGYFKTRNNARCGITWIHQVQCLNNKNQQRIKTFKSSFRSFWFSTGLLDVFVYEMDSKLNATMIFMLKVSPTPNSECNACFSRLGLFYHVHIHTVKKETSCKEKTIKHWRSDHYAGYARA